MTTCTMLETLHDFWAQTGLPCRLEGHTHRAMETPFLLYTAGRGDFGQAADVRATAWFSGKDAAQRRAETAGLIEQMLPAQGKRVTNGEGLMMFERKKEGFMEMIGNDRDPAMLGLRVQAELRVYG